MAKTYAQVIKQIDTLSREAEKLKQKEVDGVVERIKEAIAVYGLTARDLGFGTSNGVGRDSGRKQGVRKVRAKGAAKAKATRAVRFRDETGNVWVGRGPRPKWLRDALAAGKRLEDFAV